MSHCHLIAVPLFNFSVAFSTVVVRVPHVMDVRGPLQGSGDVDFREELAKSSHVTGSAVD